MQEISWTVELAVKPGMLDAFRSLTSEMVAAVQREPGVLAYQRFASSDGKTVHVYERYADSASALAHLRAFADTFSSDFRTMVERRRFIVFGEPDAELRALLDRYGATYFRPLLP